MTWGIAILNQNTYVSGRKADFLTVVKDRLLLGAFANGVVENSDSRFYS